jgi:hypothetical protein
VANRSEADARVDTGFREADHAVFPFVKQAFFPDSPEIDSNQKPPGDKAGSSKGVLESDTDGHIELLIPKVIVTAL